MDARDYVQRQVAWVRRTSDAVTDDLTDAQLSWTPPGTANPIGATLLHTILSEDSFLHRVIQGKPTVFESQGWAEQLGVSAQPGRGPSWDDMKSKPLSLAKLLAYQQAVQADTDAYLADLTPEELDRKVTTFRGESPVGDVLALFVGHAAHHVGEIAAIKGAQGAKGTPF